MPAGDRADGHQHGADDTRDSEMIGCHGPRQPTADPGQKLPLASRDDIQLNALDLEPAVFGDRQTEILHRALRLPCRLADASIRLSTLLMRPMSRNQMCRATHALRRRLENVRS